jgi:hypothetical protein
MKKLHSYLVDIKKLKVVRYNLHDIKESMEHFKKASSNKGWYKTDKRIYDRFTKGALTKDSFKDVEYPKGSGKFIKSNIYY